ncbi:MAG: HAD hydrolase-like protein [Candidatus Lokiarchaeota archaeon]|nr:HAD hydrolase-like protein [Candidatus Lokiarchaeota archaeon]
MGGSSSLSVALIGAFNQFYKFGLSIHDIAQKAYDINIDLSNSFMVGDTLNDIKTGKIAKCKTVLVLTGYGKEEQKKDDQLKPDLVFQNLLDFAQKI